MITLSPTTKRIHTVEVDGYEVSGTVYYEQEEINEGMFGFVAYDVMIEEAYKDGEYIDDLPLSVVIEAKQKLMACKP